MKMKTEVKYVSDCCGADDPKPTRRRWVGVCRACGCKCRKLGEISPGSGIYEDDGPVDIYEDEFKNHREYGW
ncbi:MAG: hypothetical protein EBW65_11775 [Gammaproteobacteria bacterium]|nr:hypothetical protein [Gammaproteobacteria bacterium]